MSDFFAKMAQRAWISRSDGRGLANMVSPIPGYPLNPAVVSAMPEEQLPLPLPKDSGVLKQEVGPQFESNLERATSVMQSRRTSENSEADWTNRTEPVPAGPANVHRKSTELKNPARNTDQDYEPLKPTHAGMIRYGEEFSPGLPQYEARELPSSVTTPQGAEHEVGAQQRLRTSNIEAAALDLDFQKNTLTAAASSIRRPERASDSRISRGSATLNPASAVEAPVIKVSIARVEVRAVMTQHTPRQTVRPTPRSALQDYLESRNQGEL